MGSFGIRLQLAYHGRTGSFAMRSHAGVCKEVDIAVLLLILKQHNMPYAELFCILVTLESFPRALLLAPLPGLGQHQGTHPPTFRNTITPP